MTTRGFCACCGMPECIIDGIDGRECFHCGDGAPMPVDEVAAAVTAERARCAAVCREVAAGYSARDYDALDDGAHAHRAAGALECAEAIERGAVEQPAGDGAALADIAAAVRTERECEEYVREATAECERLLPKSTKWAFDRAKQELARAEASLGDARATLRKHLDALVVERGAVTR